MEAILAANIYDYRQIQFSAKRGLSYPRACRTDISGYIGRYIRLF